MTAAVLRAFEGVRSSGVPVGVNAFDPAVAETSLAAGASFLLVGADVALLARGPRNWLPGSWAPPTTVGRATEGEPAVSVRAGR